jgi:hypothetical protein
VPEVEAFAEPVFEFVGLWEYYLRLYTSWGAYYGAMADELARLGGDAERVADYRRRAADKTKWAASVRQIQDRADKLAVLLADQLGVVWPALDGHRTLGTFRMRPMESGSAGGDA